MSENCVGKPCICQNSVQNPSFNRFDGQAWSTRSTRTTRSTRSIRSIKVGKTLKYLKVAEGERSNKNPHLPLDIGGLPSHVKFNQFDRLFTNAKLNVENIDAEHKVDVRDSGWIEYITKELGTKDTDNVLWTLA